MLAMLAMLAASVAVLQEVAVMDSMEHVDFDQNDLKKNEKTRVIFSLLNRFYFE